MLRKETANVVRQARSGQSKRDELFGGRRDVETGDGGSAGQTAEAKLSEADHYQDKTEEAYKVGYVIFRVLIRVLSLGSPASMPHQRSRVLASK